MNFALPGLLPSNGLALMQHSAYIGYAVARRLGWRSFVSSTSRCMLRCFVSACQAANMLGADEQHTAVVLWAGWQRQRGSAHL